MLTNEKLASPGGHSVFEWVGVCVRKSKWKGTFWCGLSYSGIEIGKCEKRFFFLLFYQILNKMVIEIDKMWKKVSFSQNLE